MGEDGLIRVELVRDAFQLRRRISASSFACGLATPSVRGRGRSGCKNRVEKLGVSYEQLKQLGPGEDGESEQEIFPQLLESKNFKGTYTAIEDRIRTAKH